MQGCTERGKPSQGRNPAEGSGRPGMRSRGRQGMARRAPWRHRSFGTMVLPLRPFPSVRLRAKSA